MAMRYVIGIVVGGGIGFAVGYFGRCASGTCPLTGNPWVSTLFGMFVGVLMVSAASAPGAALREVGSGSPLPEKMREKARRELAAVKRPVRLTVFSQEFQCPSCAANDRLVGEIASLSDEVHLTVLDFEKDAEEAKRLGLERIPATVIAGGDDARIRFFGVPGGYEFLSFVAAIRLVGAGEPGLKPDTIAALARLANPVRIRVFATPACPYCVSAAELACRFAVASPRITVEVIDANEFVPLSGRYQVFAVPKVVLNETVQFEGARSEEEFLGFVLQAGGSG